jgi:hypothetical protein
MRAQALPTCCGLSITRASRCRGSSSKALTSVSAAAAARLPVIEPPVLMYRERSAVAGEGTALKIGNTVSVADVWTEISQPPYFVAYHGASLRTSISPSLPAPDSNGQRSVRQKPDCRR